MPVMETAWRYQKAMLRAAEGFDNYGNPRVANTPVELDVRWEQTDREVTDPQGNNVGVDIMAVVDREVPVGSVLWFGSDVKPTADLRYVVSYQETPDVKGRHYRRVLYLARVSDQRPSNFH